ncbi:transcriptional regulator family: Fungal Specific TF [Penicillium paradoxum]|uniref:transcriptional regulator family: Fungal Specific TF n=1 Tax=Penicillium paradoxum TaxID=176176 RepID=UPI0025474357|nr:transcriptional regulator family: Fungal Specific TF [Penicillium paradoxum]KAJ5773552.1 transcriptional regulator family: Fungal Specific TF [Penicillium paradoxum]
MRRLLPSSISPSPSSEIEDIAHIETTQNEGADDVSSPSMDGDCAEMICTEGVGISTSRSQCPSALPDKKVDWEQVLAAYEAGFLQGNFVLQETQSDWDSGPMNDVLMNDLDALLRF